MSTWCPLILAQAPAPPTSSPGSPGSNLFFFALMIGVVVFMLLSARSQRGREKRERESMYSKLAKNDRVQTIGGVIGTIMAVKETEVVLKVDETTNTKMTFVKSAIQRVLTDNGPASTDKV